MVVALQIFFVLLLIILIILFVFRPRQVHKFIMPDNYQELLLDYVSFYQKLDKQGQEKFDDRLQKFLSGVKISGANAVVEDLDLVLIGAAAVIPVFYIPDWQYVNLREILLYPGNFNMDYEQHGNERTITGMVGTGHMENVMILSKWELRQGFINASNNRNTAIHEFAHLIDKMDGTLDGVPEILLERKYVQQWKDLLQQTITDIFNGRSDIDVYGATNPVECFAVICEYFFEQPGLFRERHPELSAMMERIFLRGY